MRNLHRFVNINKNNFKIFPGNSLWTMVYFVPFTDAGVPSLSFRKTGCYRVVLVLIMSLF